MKQVYLLYIAGGNVNGIDTMEISLVISHKVKCTFFTQSSICNTRHLSQRSESYVQTEICTKKNGHNEFIHNSQKLETPKIYYNK